ncbi:NAD-dependent epimerase/dehydratase family protein [Deinococcus yavapaiensis]|uniref:2'-hydroxyisoflavone reductase n=1 Tax=Deinococcus yavapaiensis KR-236 TaxID=694435 RepID=A0A318S8R1_9DEIO|nr:NAD-dependent epimerase/dehydratase family protein [Deinococcus yavapaiensis]PYE54236.1 2'-hydroxyisoflavone reductase [Deinococcus yavapaiensis KR-236]
MRLLILGGTQFVGKHIVLTALDRGHDVTIFTRGKGRDDLPETVERLRGDRDGDLSALQGRTWDACIDVSGYVPRIVRASAEQLRESVSFYAFISTVSVYADFSEAPITEDSPLIDLPDKTVEQITGETYGGLKVLCEQAVRDVYGDRCSMIRPDIVAGAFDPTDRFTYWVERLANNAASGLPILAPGDGSDLIQFVDARDLAAFTLHTVEERVSGAFNVCGDALRFDEFLSRAASALGVTPTLEWKDVPFLQQNEVTWNDLPMFVPSASEQRGLMDVSNERAKAAGFTPRDVEDTVGSVHGWTVTRTSPERRAGMSAEREQELLKA